MASSSSSSSRGRRLPMIFMLLAIVVAIGAGLAAGGMAVAKKQAPKPVPAPATTGATIKATSFEVAPKQTGDANAKCSGKKRALGGGVVQVGPPTSDFSMRASGPLDSTGSAANTQSGDIAKQWYAAIFNKTAQPQNFKVLAICSARSDATIKAKAFQASGGGDTVEAWSVCPANKRALGGGVVQVGAPSDDLGVRASSPLDSTGSAANTQSGDIAKQWYAAVFNWTAQPQNFKVLAICSARSNATIEATESVAAEGATRAAWSVCPANKLRSLGGGVFSKQDPPYFPPYFFLGASGPLDSSGKPFLTESGDMARQWYTVINNDSKQGQKLKVFAICE